MLYSILSPSTHLNPAQIVNLYNLSSLPQPVRSITTVEEPTMSDQAHSVGEGSSKANRRSDEELQRAEERLIQDQQEEEKQKCAKTTPVKGPDKVTLERKAKEEQERRMVRNRMNTERRKDLEAGRSREIRERGMAEAMARRNKLEALAKTALSPSKDMSQPPTNESSTNVFSSRKDDREF